MVARATSTSRRSSSSSRMLLQQSARPLQATWLGETTALLQLTCNSSLTTAAVTGATTSTGTSLSEQGQATTGHNTRPADTVNILFNPSKASTSSTPTSIPRFSLLDCSINTRRRRSTSSAAARNSSSNTADKTASSSYASRLDELPDIHYVCITDARPSKLDTDTILGVYKRDGARFFVPKNGISALEQIGIPAHHIMEVAPWQDQVVSYSAAVEGKTLRFTAIPTSTSGTNIDEKVTASSSTSKSRKGNAALPTAHWLVQHESSPSEKSDADSGDESSTSSRSAILFVGATVASEQQTQQQKSTVEASEKVERDVSTLRALWKDVATRYGPLDLAFLPIWAGKRTSPSLFQKIFAKSTIRKVETFAPSEAAEVHQALSTRISIAMLHGVEARPPTSKSRAFGSGSSNDDSDDEDEEDSNGGGLEHLNATSRAIARSPEAQKAITELKSACDRSARRSVEFRRAGGLGSGSGSGSGKNTKRNSLLIASGGRRGFAGSLRGRGQGKSTFVLLSPHQSVSL